MSKFTLVAWSVLIGASVGTGVGLITHPLIGVLIALIVAYKFYDMSWIEIEEERRD